MPKYLLPVVLTLALAPMAVAQAPAPAAPTAQPEAEAVTITLRHIPPTLLARTIKPRPKKSRDGVPTYTHDELQKIGKDSPLPPGVTRDPATGRIQINGPFRLIMPPIGDTFALPEGVDSLAPDATARTVKAVGTPAGIADLRRLIATLDVPQPRIEVEIHIVSLSLADAQSLLDNTIAAFLPRAARPTGAAFSRAISGAKDALQNLLDSNRARDLLLHRVIALNEARVQATLDASAFEGEDDLLVQATPRLRANGNITMRLMARVGKDQFFSTDVRDDETLAFVLPLSGPDKGRAVAALVTPLLVAREDAAK